MINYFHPLKGILKHLRKGERKNNITILLGNALDHYDTHIYSLLAPFIASVFFAQRDNLTNQMWAFSIASVGIITRPLGAIIFGRLALLLGPLKALRYSLVGVAIATFLIGILPSYQQVGALAPFMLLCMRALQSVFASGEGSIAGLYIISTTHNRRKRNVSSIFYSMSNVLGMLIAAGVANLIGASSAPTKYWRVGFIFGFLTSIVSVFIRATSYKIKNVQSNRNQQGFFSIIKNHKNTIWRIAFLNGFSYISYPIVFTIMNSILPRMKGISIQEALGLHSMLIMLDACVIPLGGMLLKYVKIERFMLWGIMLIILISSILFYFLPMMSLTEIMIFRILLIIIGVPFGMALKIWTADITDTYGEEKYLVAAVGGGIGMELLGRSITILALLLFTKFSSLVFLTAYIAILGLMAAYAITWNSKKS